MAYFDVAATTKPRPEVIETMIPYLTSMWQNPSSLYSSSVTIKNAIEDARQTVAKFINADTDEIIFTSGGSESNCAAIQGFISYCRSIGKTPTIITSTVEHKSILLCVGNEAENLYYVDVDSEGFIKIEDLWKILKSIPKDNMIFVSIQFANNEIGTIQHIKEISKMVHSFGGVFHTDAVQAFGHELIDVQELGIDMLSASGHKINAVNGTGILYKNKNIKINPLIYGTQENGLRGGTENVAGIIGFAKAVELLQKDIVFNNRSTTFKRNYLISKLQSMGCVLNGAYNQRLSNNINVTFPQKIAGEALIYMMDSAGFQISAGSACNSHSQSISHVLDAIGLNEDEALRTVRITLPDDIDMKDLDSIVSEFKKAIKILDISV